MGQRFRRVSAPMPAGCVQLQSRHDAASPATQARASVELVLEVIGGREAQVSGKKTPRLVP